MTSQTVSVPRLLPRFTCLFFFVLIASQHSGTVDEDKEDEEEGETRCTVCDKPFQDIEL